MIGASAARRILTQVRNHDWAHTYCLSCFSVPVGCICFLRFCVWIAPLCALRGLIELYAEVFALVDWDVCGFGLHYRCL